jgi:phosphoribosylanthranilate isomerase
MPLSQPHLRYKTQTRRERTLTIHLISIEKTVKALVLIVVGLKLLTLFDQDVHAWASDLVTRHGIDVGNRFVHAALERLVGVTNSQIVTFGVVALFYSAVLLVEATGLWLQKRWAEYLTAISTALLLPLELYEMYERFTWVRIAIFVINVFIVWYLVTRLRDENKETIAGTGVEPLRPRAPRVKICGITNLEDAQLAFDSGADQLGLNFYEKSPRYISPDKARELVDSLPSTLETVGVFVNKPIDGVLAIAEHVGLNGIQLHGDEDYKYVKELGKRTSRFVIKAFRVSQTFSIADAMDWHMDYALFDSFSSNERGGTGVTLNWEEVATDIFLWFPFTAYLAGGLTPENVADAVRTVKPYAVDVASGVESTPGRKDPIKVAAFIKAAKEAI